MYPEAPENPGGKLNQVVDNIYEEYIRAESLGIIGTQLVFSDIGTPKSSWKEEMLTLFTCAYFGTRRFVARCRVIDSSPSDTSETSEVSDN